VPSGFLLLSDCSQIHTSRRNVMSHKSFATKKTFTSANHSQKFPLWLAVMLVIIVVLAIALLLSTNNAGATSIRYIEYTGGDCHAQQATGDTYKDEIDMSCLNLRNIAVWLTATPNRWTQTVVPQMSTATPDEQDDTVPTPETITTPVPTKTIVTPEPTQPVIVITTPAPTQPAVTPEPTQPPVVTETPEPTQPVVVVEPTEEACKNKNSGKDGTPDECNAGGGQEKNQ
jgi:hypothetical protein